jgi:AcrR family transcriptional regulator
MTEQEFERLRRRFGADVSAWPAPHRQEALAHLAGDKATTGTDEALDRLVLAAALRDTDEAALTRKVLARMARERETAALRGGPWRLWTIPAAASAFAVLLMMACVGGYMAAGDGTEGLDDALLAFALGAGEAGGSELLSDELGAEEQL